jgi:hypothetical protein
MYPGVLPYVALPDTSKAVLIDIDGTVANLNGRDPYDQTICLNDLPNKPVIEVIRSFVVNRGLVSVFVSGRPVKCIEATSNWLYRHVIPHGYPWALYMRKNGDYRPDWEAKLELFNEHVRDRYNILAAFDDRNQVVKLWRQLGITTFQVADGNF